MDPRVSATWRAVALVLLTGVLLGPTALARLFLGRAPRWLTRLWHRGCCAIAGLRIRVHGIPEGGRPTLFVANHVSYLDIVILGSLVDAAFVAKSEVDGWPGIGLIARIGRTVFVRRTATESLLQRNALAARLDAGENLLLFAEGTSSDGVRVLPFKSALFAAVEGRAAGARVKVQPVTLLYSRLRGGLPIDHTLRPLYAWYGDMDLLPHLWAVLGLPGADVEVCFHPPVIAAEFGCRKALARHAQRQVADGLAAARLAA